MTSRELQELRRALERLRDALNKAVRALDEVGETSSDAADEYGALGAPFGEDPTGRRLWSSFRQYTTRN